METGAKIGIGIGVALLVGTGIYFGFIHKTKQVAADPNLVGGVGGQPAGSVTAPKETELQKKLTAAKKLALTAKCNKQTPPPRFKKEKVEEYKKCMLGADGYTWGNA